MEIFIGLLIGTAIIVAVVIASPAGHDRKIHEKIESMGGIVLNIERRDFFAGLGPFMMDWGEKSTVVYKIAYQTNNQRKEIWVKFGILFGAEWKEGKGE